LRGANERIHKGAKELVDDLGQMGANAKRREWENQNNQLMF